MENLKSQPELRFNYPRFIGYGKDMLNQLKKDLNKSVKPGKTEVLSRFFKTGPGEYGEGDVFLGLNSQQIKDVAKKYSGSLNFKDLSSLLKSKIHEERMLVMRILVSWFEKGDEKKKERVYKFYLSNMKGINNWDLVDVSSPNIVGNYLLDKDRQLLYKFIKSNNLWQRRIAVLATFSFIRKNDFKDILKLAEISLTDKHDLMHKAVGWMLREMGKRDQKLLENFLNKWVKQMPRTMLRYSIERFPQEKRKYYLNR